MFDPCPDNEIAAVVLAAGTSRRFGSNKLLHPMTRHGVTLPLAAHSLLHWLYAFENITVVVRPETETFCDTIMAALGMTGSGPIRWVVCADAAQGMAASLACGVRANHDAAGWLIGLADMPAVPLEAITGVRNALLYGAGLAAPCCDGRRGHPVGFASNYRDELLALQGDAGARQVLERNASDIVQVRIGDGGIFADIDMPGDLCRNFPQASALQDAADNFDINQASRRQARASPRNKEPAPLPDSL